MTETNRVLLSLGSNQNRYRNLVSGLNALASACGALVLSPVYESEAVGFEGDPFLNLVVELQTSMSCGELNRLLKQIEDEHGRDRKTARFSGRTLDIDILTFASRTGVVDGVVLPRDEILTSAFVLRPLADLCPDELHPVLLQSYHALWLGFDQDSQKLWPVAFSWPEPFSPVQPEPDSSPDATAAPVSGS